MSRLKRSRKIRVWQRDGFICRYCKRNLNPLDEDLNRFINYPDLTVDHVIPLSQGGTHDMSNLVTCCFSCNHAKAIREAPIILNRVN